MMLQDIITKLRERNYLTNMPLAGRDAPEMTNAVNMVIYNQNLQYNYSFGHASKPRDSRSKLKCRSSCHIFDPTVVSCRLKWILYSRQYNNKIREGKNGLSTHTYLAMRMRPVIVTALDVILETEPRLCILSCSFSQISYSETAHSINVPAFSMQGVNDVNSWHPHTNTNPIIKA